MVVPFVSILIAGLAPVANLLHPSWRLALECAVSFILGPNLSVLSFFILVSSSFSFSGLSVNLSLHLYPHQELAAGGTKLACTQTLIRPPAKSVTRVWLAQGPGSRSES
ncbi:hypothetical protein DPMN_188769 [Dreissena polymorpha]|uniref:Uncharacterized protein n=1 Tax=Dreissena polymorpha TaxID=45954 RepID=A0A9D4I8S4_DREPO|nr:hypothetical protein DPMN_188704 [Dreissena polymorpha]KAH3754108.1 hypothetical protein DPMN_188769 [Dreissena polymorpha]